MEASRKPLIYLAPHLYTLSGGQLAEGPRGHRGQWGGEGAAEPPCPQNSFVCRDPNTNHDQYDDDDEQPRGPSRETIDGGTKGQQTR